MHSGAPVCDRRHRTGRQLKRLSLVTTWTPNQSDGHAVEPASAPGRGIFRESGGSSLDGPELSVRPGSA